MKQSIDDRLDELLDINNEAEEVVKETNKQLVPRDQNGRFTERKDEQQVDYKYTRNTLYGLVERGQDAIEGILDLAKESEHPRTYEVAGQLIKTVSETSEKLLQIQKMMDDLEDDRPRNQTTNQNLFVGSTAELQKLLKNNAKTEE
tara:strand:- start:4168 stop:4605 length:438 start_codon:yes stop_codon:yes gene_type:complete